MKTELQMTDTARRHAAVPKVKLNNGVEMPLLGFGVFQVHKSLEENGVQHESWGPFVEGKNNLFKNETLASIGKRYSKSIAQVVLRWLTQGSVVAIPKSVHKERMEENFNIFDFQLSDEDMRSMQTLDQKASAFFDHRDPNIVKWLAGRKLDI
jgi:diketogulonate reductase-like aldo/keto reductase